MVFPLVVPLVMARVGIGAGVGVALVLSGLWFVAMLKTSEMPTENRGTLIKARSWSEC